MKEGNEKPGFFEKPGFSPELRRPCSGTALKLALLSRSVPWRFSAEAVPGKH